MKPDARAAHPKTLASLPRSILLLEGLGALLLAFALIAFNQLIALPAWLSGKGAAQIMIVTGVLCMLPAAALMMWRTAQMMAPQLFATKPSHEEDKHDADH